MRQFRTVSFALSFWLILSLVSLAPGQDQTLKARYREALARAQENSFEQAYAIAFRIVRADEFYYEAQVLHIALAAILKKTGSEDPKNLIRIAKNYAPLGSDLERDVQNMVNSLNGTPIVAPKDGSVVPTEKEVAVSPYVSRKIALVVGIGSFKDPKINSLRFAPNDARVFADTLKKECRFDDVTVLIDADATRHKILTEVVNISKNAQLDDIVVIYIASHGSPQNLDSAGINYIVTHDSEVDNLYPTSYAMKNLLEDIEIRIPAQRIVAFIDTCFSGATFKQKPSGWASSSRGLVHESAGLALEEIKTRLRNSKKDKRVSSGNPNDGRRQQGIGRVIIASSRQNQKSWESDTIKHGYFTHYLIEALKRRNEVSVQNIYDYLSTEVPKAVRLNKGAEQNPTMVSSTDGPVNIYIKN